MSTSNKRTGLVKILLVAGGLTVASLGLGAGTASADIGDIVSNIGGGGSGGGLGGLGGLAGGGGGGGLLSKVTELQPIIDAVREDPQGMIGAVMDNPGELIGLLGG